MTLIIGMGAANTVSESWSSGYNWSGTASDPNRSYVPASIMAIVWIVWSKSWSWNNDWSDAWSDSWVSSI